MRQPRFELSLDILRHNVRAWLGYLAGRELWAVVKSDAYGLGLGRVAPVCIEAGAQRLCVVDMSEALELRALGITAPIVHVWATPADELEQAVRNDVIVTIEDVGVAKDLSRIAVSMGKIAVAHVAVETGTGWSGIPSSRGAAFANAVNALPGVRWEGAWTHIASREQMLAQLDQFYTAVDAMRAHGLPVPMDHVAATAPTLWGVGGQAARIGVGLYGGHPGATVRGLPLRTAVSLHATVLYTKQFEQATSLGYGGASIAKPGECIVTLRLGYADGLPRSLAVGGQIIVSGERCPIVGAIGMNFTMIRVPYGVTVRQGDEALVLGDAPGVALDEVAGRAGTIPHQLITSLSALSARPSV
ncbi:MAG: alanine racemase [Candidatus Eremiobacteraeota bacterium]|nr:alanine racemase [Candidatus Eremiobacteraeota bacterium]